MPRVYDESGGFIARGDFMADLLPILRMRTEYLHS